VGINLKFGNSDTTKNETQPFKVTKHSRWIFEPLYKTPRPSKQKSAIKGLQKCEFYKTHKYNQRLQNPMFFEIKCIQKPKSWPTSAMLTFGHHNVNQ
jgi:hypothetical protein